MSFILGSNYSITSVSQLFVLGFRLYFPGPSALFPTSLTMDSLWWNYKMGNGRLGLQCLAPGVWDMGHLAGFYQLEERGGCVTRCGALEACRSPVSCPVPPRSVVWGPFV